MTATGRILALLGALMMLMGCTCCVPLDTSESGRGRCSPLDYSDLIEAFKETGLSYGVLRVPVVVHLMDRHGETTVLDKWTEFDYLRTFFDASGEHSVNRLWAPAGIRFDVERVEHCTYARSLPATDKAGNVLAPDPSMMREDAPAQQQQRIDSYLETNNLYGNPRAVNVYVWPSLAGIRGFGIRGYGESPRRNRVEVIAQGLEAVATAWYGASNNSCQNPSALPFCQKIFAHELGHAVGLKHVCRSCQSPSPPNPSCCTNLCWSSGLDPSTSEPREYYSYQRRPNDDRLCFPPLSEGPELCCCGCEPGDAIRDAVNACGRPYACCDLSFKSWLMHADATESEGLLCEGEMQAARSTIRQLFPSRAGGTDGKRIIIEGQGQTQR